MSVNMPHLHSLLSEVLLPEQVHSALLLSVNGAVVVSACGLPPQQRQRTILTLAAIAADTWKQNREVPPEAEDGEGDGQGDAVQSQPQAQGGWATSEVGNLFVSPILPSSKEPQKETKEQNKSKDVMFLIALCGPEEAEWDILEERTRKIAEYVAPSFAGYSESSADTPPISSSKLPGTPRQLRM